MGGRDAYIFIFVLFMDVHGQFLTVSLYLFDFMCLNHIFTILINKWRGG